mmetsp:Transcript_26900/g.48612  ORF Transcript_26900/g.48612 Transcript_26900/m.48612 type:complete len:151 (+) Transcript_26900:71-523(+)
MPRAPGISFSCLIAVVAVIMGLVGMQKCFMAPAVTMPMAPEGSGAASFELAGADIDGTSLTSGMPLASSETPEAREVKVAMSNSKRGRRDKSHSWNRVSKYRKCSLMARAATVRGRKIIARQLKSGKSAKRLGPGDYENPKMQKIKRAPF